MCDRTGTHAQHVLLSACSGLANQSILEVRTKFIKEKNHYNTYVNMCIKWSDKRSKAVIARLLPRYTWFVLSGPLRNNGVKGKWRTIKIGVTTGTVQYTSVQYTLTHGPKAGGGRGRRDASPAVKNLGGDVPSIFENKVTQIRRLF